MWINKAAEAQTKTDKLQREDVCIGAEERVEPTFCYGNAGPLISSTCDADWSRGVR
jgi:hypothetical protein